MDDGIGADPRVGSASTLQEKRRITVHDGTRPVEQLNELEWVRGEIYANIWQTDRIVAHFARRRARARLDRLDGHPERRRSRRQVDVLNGIAYDSLGDRLFVTGKLWPKLFEIKVVPKRRPD